MKIKHLSINVPVGVANYYPPGGGGPRHVKEMVIDWIDHPTTRSNYQSDYTVTLHPPGYYESLASFKRRLLDNAPHFVGRTWTNKETRQWGGGVVFESTPEAREWINRLLFWFDRLEENDGIAGVCVCPRGSK